MDIQVAFLFAGNLPRQVAQRMIDSVRENMPRATIIHQTDYETQGFEGCKTVRLMEPKDHNDIAEFFWRHTKLLKGPFIKLDYDCVMMQSCAGVFNQDFEVGLTIRDDRDVSLSNTFRLRHPHNAGVMFSKTDNSFWSEVYDAYMAIPERDGWMDACDALETAVERTKVKLLDFPAYDYNYTPVSPYERLDNKFIVHYKGNRKHWNGVPAAQDAGEDVKRRVNEWSARRLKNPELAE